MSKYSSKVKRVVSLPTISYTVIYIIKMFCFRLITLNGVFVCQIIVPLKMLATAFYFFSKMVCKDYIILQGSLICKQLNMSIINFYNIYSVYNMH